MLLLLSEVNSPVLAAEMTIMPEAATPIAAADLRPSGTEAFENHRMELGSVNSDNAFRFVDDAPSPLFASPSISNVASNSGLSEWDYLWRNASRIPITSIPEPTVGSLLIGGAIVLCRRRLLKAIK